MEPDAIKPDAIEQEAGVADTVKAIRAVKG
jgi:hypothetical protein